MVRPALLPPLLLAILLAGCRRPEPLPELGRLPDFTLTDERGEPFEARNLHGRVWIVDFFFTSCPTYCPLLTEKMKGLREALRAERERIGFLSISVDPATDTPEVLRRYAEKHGLRLGARELPPWHLLTGPTEKVGEVVVGAFRVPMGAPRPRPGAEGVYDILHARHFVLVDGRRTLRGFYRVEEEPLRRLAEDARRLADELEE